MTDSKKPSFWKRKIWKLPMFTVPLLAVLVAGIVVAAAVLLGPPSTPAPTTVQEITVSISGVPTDTLWGDQYTPQVMNVSVETNTYTASHTTIAFIVLGATENCTELASMGFTIRVSPDAPDTWTDISNTCADASTLSYGPDVWGADHVSFISGAASEVITAGSTAHYWLFEVTLVTDGVTDVFGETFTYSAQTITA
jgi:hypothetical protein